MLVGEESKVEKGEYVAPERTIGVRRVEGMTDVQMFDKHGNLGRIRNVACLCVFTL